MTTTATQLDGRGIVQACSSCGQRNRVPFSGLGARVKCGRCGTHLAALDFPINIEDADSFGALIHSETPLPRTVRAA